MSELSTGSAYGGDISSSLINKRKFEILIPPTPEFVNPEALTPQEQTNRLIFKGLIDSYIKCVAILDGNIQKAYHLIIGQCTDLLQSKLKQQAQWSDISQNQDGIALITLIKTITFKLGDQKFLPLALYQSKANLYAHRQSNMTNNEYLQRFQNLVDVASAYNGQLYDQSILNIIMEKRHTGLAYETLTDEQKLDANSSASELYQATMFLHQSDHRRYGISSWKNSRMTSLKAMTINLKPSSRPIISFASTNITNPSLCVGG
jgi:hypothetical protein